MTAIGHCSTEIGRLCLEADDGVITGIRFGDVTEGLPEKETDLLCRAAGQLREYFEGNRREFDLPLRPQGTGFQLRVWESLRAIPYGETSTYGRVAVEIGSLGAAPTTATPSPF